MLFIISKLIKYTTWHFRALPAMVISAFFTAVLYRTRLSPRWLAYVRATLAVKPVDFFTFLNIAYDTAS
jgi:hypothetical protein